MPFFKSSRPHTDHSGGWLFAMGALVALFLAMQPVVVLAHPMGNFSINRYSRLAIDAHQVEIFHVLDMAEIPAYSAQKVMDTDGDGEIDQTERETYLAELHQTLAQALQLQVDGKSLVLTLVAMDMAFQDGQAGLSTLRVESTWLAPREAGETTATLLYRDDSFADRIGWREIVMSVDEQMTILESTAPQVDVSNALRTFPTDKIQAPLDMSQAEIVVARSENAVSIGAGSTESDTAMSVNRWFMPDFLANSDHAFAALIQQQQLGLLAIVFALAAAFGWGALHALSPGHGKSIAGAYLVGSRGTVRHAFFLGVTTTIAHTTGVFLMGVVALAASQFIVPEQLFPWLSAISGVLVVYIGLTMIRQRLGQTDTNGHTHNHGEGHWHTHEQAPHHHGPDATNGHQHDHAHDHHAHDHSEHGHSHMPPGADGSPVTWRSLLALGISGGIIPCPSALVVMLGAVALDRIAFGLLLVVVFSIGLASVLTAIGVMVVHSGKLLKHMPQSGRLLQWVPVASAAFITIVGIGITVRALAEMRLPLP